MSKLIKWYVEPPATGAYRSFQKRGWPMGFTKTSPEQRVFLLCDDEYIPCNVKSGNHGLIKIRVECWNRQNEEMVIGTIEKRAETLAQAKVIAEKFFVMYKSYLKEPRL